MIDTDFIFAELGGAAALWDTSGADQCKLAHAAETVMSRGLRAVSVTPDSVPVLWPWLENAPVEIISRFYMPPRGGDDALSDLARRCRASFRMGASGAQIFISAGDLQRFASVLGPVRDDLFFGRRLSIGVDIADIEPLAWPDVWNIMCNIHADAIVVALTRDNGDKSDFVGRVYGMLDAWRDDFAGDVHFYTGVNPVRIDQARRLVHVMRPGLDSRTMFFINDF